MSYKIFTADVVEAKACPEGLEWHKTECNKQGNDGFVEYTNSHEAASIRLANSSRFYAWMIRARLIPYYQDLMIPVGLRKRGDPLPIVWDGET